ncbi:MAG: hypothetical protein KDK45_08785 [Leptospiraceae bacterium]|nr:hypothetical protein [Leptospiraceae bacterium]
MGQYKLWIGFKEQLGFMISQDYEFINISLPFIEIKVGLDKDATGICFFGNSL